jgi:Protein of unknown function (DUF1091)
MVRKQQTSNLTFFSNFFQESVSASRFVLTKTTQICTPGWLNGSFSVINTTDDQLLSLDITLQRLLDYKIVLAFQIFKIEGRVRKKVLQIPKINYCDAQRKGFIIPVLSDILKVLADYGNIVAHCPVKPGSYVLEEFPINYLPIATIIPLGNYGIVFQLIDENKAKPLNLWKLELYLSKQ